MTALCLFFLVTPYNQISHCSFLSVAFPFQVNFINHFSGCQLCTQQNKEGDYGVCEAEYTKSFEYASGVFSKLLKRMPPRDITHQMQLAATPYCKVFFTYILQHASLLHACPTPYCNRHLMQAHPPLIVLHAYMRA